MSESDRLQADVRELRQSASSGHRQRWWNAIEARVILHTGPAMAAEFKRFQ
jgi:hypothetical protein